MSRAISYRSRPFWPSYIALLLFILILTSMTLQRVAASPLPDSSYENLNESSESSTKNSMENLTKNSIESSTDTSMNSSTDSSMDSSMDSLMNSSADSSTDNSSENASDVYVIKAVVYEIGILADMDTTSSESSESTERQERVDISLYDTPQEDLY